MSNCGVAGDVSSCGDAGDLLVLLVCKHVKINTVKIRDKYHVAYFNLLRNYFLSDSFETPSVYCMHHNTFSNCFVCLLFRSK